MTIQQVERWWDSHPCNLNHSAAPVGSLTYSRQVTAKKHTVEPHIPKFAKFWEWRGKRVLEIGCGIGTAAIAFAKAGADVVAYDLSSVSLEIAKKRALAENVDIEFLQRSAENALFPEELFDLVFSFGVIHHTPRPGRILDYAYRSMKEDGEFRFMVYNRWSTKALGLFLKYWRPGMSFDDAVAKHSEAQGGCPVTFTYTPRKITKMVENSGMYVVSIEKAHIFPYIIKHYRQHRYIKRWYYRLMPQVMFRWLERHFGWHLLVVAKRSGKCSVWW